MTPSPRPARGSRPILIVLGAALLSIVLCCGGCGLLVTFGVRRGQAEDQSAKAFVRTAVETAGKDWSFASFRPYAAPTWTTFASEAKSRATFDDYRRVLGALRKLDEPTTQGFFFGNQNGLPPGTRVTMRVPATFEKAQGTIRVRAAKIEGRWGIERLEIDSPALRK